ncbi:sialate O-acetylesterase [Catenovulum sp. 2E275]|uniref:sialate O-acetylesterase n=1 Tax=Catenovulum sp. 2E275 TaxID=2980497 RepID=UPI0021D0773D|nr:sialate O-acetylesterase [Catenovulum sp. 2E275]MCU4675243.1 sialate O-acetylesterase [Catenovulum sp. 2E275]
MWIYRKFNKLTVLISGLFILVSLTSCANLPTSQPQNHPSIYLLMGQSNMAGRDTRTLDQQVDNPKVLTLNEDNEWRVARDPIHKKTGRTEPGIGPGISFANALINAGCENKIGLVPTAVGGTPIRRWVKGGDLYEQALQKAKIASQYGTIKGMIWLQGESDSDKSAKSSIYAQQLKAMINSLRADLNQPDLAVVVGEIGYFIDQQDYPYAVDVRAAIKQVADESTKVGFASSKGLTDKGDQLHFDAQSAQEMGKRFAASMCETQNAI